MDQWEYIQKIREFNEHTMLGMWDGVLDQFVHVLDNYKVANSALSYIFREFGDAIEISEESMKKQVGKLGMTWISVVPNYDTGGLTIKLDYIIDEKFLKEVRERIEMQSKVRG